MLFNNLQDQCGSLSPCKHKQQREPTYRKAYPRTRLNQQHAQPRGGGPFAMPVAKDASKPFPIAFSDPAALEPRIVVGDKTRRQIGHKRLKVFVPAALFCIQLSDPAVARE